jgi:hypothetical protein
MGGSRPPCPRAGLARADYHLRFGDLTTQIATCQFGGRAVCSKCGCVPLRDSSLSISYFVNSPGFSRMTGDQLDRLRREGEPAENRRARELCSYSRPDEVRRVYEIRNY